MSCLTSHPTPLFFPPPIFGLPSLGAPVCVHLSPPAFVRHPDVLFLLPGFHPEPMRSFHPSIHPSISIYPSIDQSIHPLLEKVRGQVRGCTSNKRQTTICPCSAGEQHRENKQTPHNETTGPGTELDHCTVWDWFRRDSSVPSLTSSASCFYPLWRHCSS